MKKKTIRSEHFQNRMKNDRKRQNGYEIWLFDFSYIVVLCEFY